MPETEKATTTTGTVLHELAALNFRIYRVQCGALVDVYLMYGGELFDIPPLTG